MNASMLPLRKQSVPADREQFRAARIAAGAICVFALILAVGAQGLNLAFLATLAFAMAASANLPAILLTIY